MVEGLCLIPMGFLLGFWSLESELTQKIKQDQAMPCDKLRNDCQFPQPQGGSFRTLSTHGQHSGSDLRVATKSFPCALSHTPQLREEEWEDSLFFLKMTPWPFLPRSKDSPISELLRLFGAQLFSENSLRAWKE